jgi:hypothetical protein
MNAAFLWSEAFGRIIVFVCAMGLYHCTYISDTETDNIMHTSHQVDLDEIGQIISMINMRRQGERMLSTLPLPTHTVSWNFNSRLLVHRRKSCYNKLDSLW